MLTRRRLLTAGAIGLGVVIAGDHGQDDIAVDRPIARGRAAIPRANTVPALRPGHPPQLAPLTPRTDAVHMMHDLMPAAPPNAIALTIDDGPHPEWTPKMLDLLAEHRVKATFSLIGEQVKELPKLAERIVSAGHQLCNHTMTHPLEIASLSRKRVDAEITEAHDRIGDATGVAPRFFRSPGGAWSKNVFRSAARHGMTPIDWAVDPRDWARPGTKRIEHSLLDAKGGDILLCHDGGGDRSETLKALAKVIPALQQRGLVFASL
jgi:peptidoglycan/xylan/chitin deacetylase (PgdA/CDA1 family)